MNNCKFWLSTGFHGATWNQLFKACMLFYTHIYTKMHTYTRTHTSSDDTSLKIRTRIDNSVTAVHSSSDPKLILWKDFLNSQYLIFCTAVPAVNNLRSKIFLTCLSSPLNSNLENLNFESFKILILKSEKQNIADIFASLC